MDGAQGNLHLLEIDVDKNNFMSKLETMQQAMELQFHRNDIRRRVKVIKVLVVKSVRKISISQKLRNHHPLPSTS